MPDSPNDVHGSLEPLSWEHVWSDELDQIETRRRLAEYREPGASSKEEGATGGARSGRPSCAADEQSLQEVTARALSLNLVGMAFSGGGIRSATFNLGFLQGLAEQKLLKHVDYLSTVSGGGYIGAWFGVLIRRLSGEAGGFAHAEEVLQPVRRRRRSVGNAESGRESEGEPEPIAHLRAYSSYLAPKVRLFSRDSLSLVAAYVRNLVASLLVLLPALVACIAVIRLLHLAFLSNAVSSSSCMGCIAAVLTGLTLLIAMCLAGLATKRIRDVRRFRQDREQVPAAQRIHLAAGTNGVIVLLLLVSAVLLSWLSLSGQVKWLPQWLHQLSVPGWAGLMAVIFGAGAAVGHLMQELWQERFEPQGRVLFARFAGGAAGGLLIFGAVRCLSWISGVSSPSVIFVAGVSLIVLSAVLASGIVLALAGRDIPEDEREWWGLLSATAGRAALAWSAATGVVIFGPYVVGVCSHWTRGAVTAGWLASTIGGLMAAQSSRVVSASLVRRLFLVAVPYLFLAGLAGALAIGVSYAVERPQNAQLQNAQLQNAQQAWMEKRWVDYETRLRQSCPKALAVLLVACVAAGAYASRQVDVNSTSLNSMYASRLVRCYLGATRPKGPESERYGQPVDSEQSSLHPGRQPHPWTGFDPLDDLKLSELVISESDLRRRFDGPFHLFNAAINLTGSKSLAQQDRKANSFTLTPLACGNPRLGFRPTAGGDQGRRAGFAGGLTVGRAIAISGAAASPNMGEHTTPALAALMTLFNVRLGWWVGNPRDSRRWNLPGPSWALGSLLAELISGTDNEHGFVNLSDGGHFENMGVYELVRRRCRYIIAVDAGADPEGEFADLGNLVRKCRIDLGIEIEIDVTPVRPGQDSGMAQWHCAIGAIRYDHCDINAPLGTLVYIKPVLTGDESPDLVNYAGREKDFPQQSTVDQFFSESQFESYRELGYHTARAVFSEAAKWSRDVSHGESDSAQDTSQTVEEDRSESS